MNTDQRTRSRQPELAQQNGELTVQDNTPVVPAQPVNPQQLQAQIMATLPDMAYVVSMLQSVMAFGNQIAPQMPQLTQEIGQYYEEEFEMKATLED